MGRSCKTEIHEGRVAHGSGGEQVSFRLPVPAGGAPLGEVGGKELAVRFAMRIKKNCKTTDYLGFPILTVC